MMMKISHSVPTEMLGRIFKHKVGRDDPKVTMNYDNVPSSSRYSVRLTFPIFFLVNDFKVNKAKYLLFTFLQLFFLV